jgi:hypothetical protein
MAAGQLSAGCCCTAVEHCCRDMPLNAVWHYTRIIDVVAAARLRESERVGDG